MTEISELDASKVKWSGVLPLNSLVITTVLSPSTTVLEVTLTLAVSKVPGSWSPSFRSSTLPLCLVGCFETPHNEMLSYFPSTTRVQGLSAMAKLGVPKATENHFVAGPEIVMLASPPLTFAFNRTWVFVSAAVAS